jgi:hypothetical protein
LGFKENHEKDRNSYAAFRQNLLTSDVREIPIFEGRGYPTCLYLDDRRALVAETGADKPAERKLTIIDLESGMRTIRELPSDMHETFLAPDGRSCAAHRWTIQGEMIHQELTVLDVATGVWKTILTAEELPHIDVKDAVARRYPALTVSFPDRQGMDWIICTVEHPRAATTRMLINSRTGARFQLPEKNKGEVSRFSKDGSRFFTSLRIQNDREMRDSRLLTFYEIKKTGIKYLNSFRWEENAEHVWLGNDRLLYLKRGDPDQKRRHRHKRIMSDLFSDRGELWTVDIKTGQHRPFFTGR